MRGAGRNLESRICRLLSIARGFPLCAAAETTQRARMKTMTIFSLRTSTTLDTGSLSHGFHPA